MPKTSVSPDASALSVVRSDEYRTVFSDLYRVRLGNGDLTLIFSKLTHTPSISAEPDILEEQVEIVMTWSTIKMLQLHLASLIGGIEQELGSIPVPTAFLANTNLTPTAQRAVVRGFGLSTTEAAPTNEQEPPP